MTRIRRRTPLPCIAVMLGLASSPIRPKPRSPAVGGSTYIAATPLRVLDTRDGTGGVSAPLGSGGVLTSNRRPSTADATAVVLNVVAVAPSQAGSSPSTRTAHPDQPRPTWISLPDKPREPRHGPCHRRHRRVFNRFGTTDVSPISRATTSLH